MSPGRKMLTALCLFSGVATLVLLAELAALDTRLRHGCAVSPDTGCAAPHGVVDWELARTPGRAAEILEEWDLSPAVGFPDDVVAGLRTDRWFVLSYTVFLTSLIFLVSRLFRPDRRRRWLLVAVVPPVAGLLDWGVENAALAAQLDSYLAGTELVRISTAFWAAVIKFALLAGTLLALLVVAVVVVSLALARPRLRAATRLPRVIAKEREYLRERRKKADLPENSLELPPVGLALSGGGIRSATVNLGVLQALARKGVLPHVDYLSTVSGGGYIGSALSALLSINARKVGAAGRRENSADKGSEPAPKLDEYLFDPCDKPYFSTTAESFPFTRPAGPTGAGEGFGSDVQVDHLRACGEFLVRRKRLFSMELLRTVGTIGFGFFYHLVHFGLLFLAIASVYLLSILLMVGEWAMKTTSDAAYSDFVKSALGLDYPGDWRTHPFLVAAAVGALMTLVATGVTRWLLPDMRRSLFWRRGTTIRENRRIVSVIALPVVMLVTAVGITWWYTMVRRDELLNISLPLVSYLGGGVVLAVRHFLGRREDQRSRLAAREGAFLYLIIASLVLVLVVLPFLVFIEPVTERLAEAPIRNLLAWVLSILGARYLAGSGKGAEKGAKGAVAKLAATVPAFRRVFAGVALSIAVVGGLLGICVLIWNSEPRILAALDVEPTFRARAALRGSIAAAALLLYSLMGLLNFNRLSLHSFYRDRLAETYLRTLKQAAVRLRRKRDDEALPLTHVHGRSNTPLVTECVTAAPYHLVVTCLNLSTDLDRRRQLRRSDHFIFSKLYCGSETTGFLETRKYRDGKTKLGHAMTISGAAASPAMGRGSYFAQSAAMTLLNVRLGQWLENPGYHRGRYTHRRERWVFWPSYLLREALSSSGANDRLVYLSDGGHTGDNLGLVPLLKRRCRLILVGDAEFDPLHRFNSLTEALRQIQIDDGTEVDIDLSGLRPNSKSGETLRHHALGRIQYPDQSVGWLVVLKSSLTGDETEPIRNYKNMFDQFPHQTTGDLFFDEAQFESYRALGEHMATSVISGELLALATVDSANTDWNDRFVALKASLAPTAESADP